MLSSIRSVVGRGAMLPSRAVVAAGPQDMLGQKGESKRTAVNLSALKQRIKATANVAKLTGVMKLVASSKLRGVEEALEAGRPFGDISRDCITGERTKSTPEKQVRRLVLLLTTDRGLCGSVNSSLTRTAREHIDLYIAEGDEVKVFVLGEKGRAAISRDIPEYMACSIDSCFDKDPIFPLASALAERILKEEFDEISFFFNKYENAAKFTNEVVHIPQTMGMRPSGRPSGLVGYEIEPARSEETLVDLMEYGLGSLLYYTMLEAQACEVSQRVTAMDNASTNASDMVDRFTLIYNRARQAKITTELTEIISGAESIKEEVSE